MKPSEAKHYQWRGIETEGKDFSIFEILPLDFSIHSNQAHGSRVFIRRQSYLKMKSQHLSYFRKCSNSRVVVGSCLTTHNLPEQYFWSL